MALRYGDRVKETTSTTGTGTWTLGGAVSGFVAFSAIPNSADGDLVPYRAEQGSNWEVGIGTLGGSKTTHARTVILASSNSGSAVNTCLCTATVDASRSTVNSSSTSVRLSRGTVNIVTSVRSATRTIRGDGSNIKTDDSESIT